MSSGTPGQSAASEGRDARRLGYKYLLAWTVSGFLWGCLVGVLTFGMTSRAIWGGVIASPVIGCLIGAATRRWSFLPKSLRIVTALLSLYVAAALFGLGVGLYDWLAFDRPHRIPTAVVLQSILAYLWGLTFLGWFVVLWPLAYANHWLLGRWFRKDRVRKRVD